DACCVQAAQSGYLEGREQWFFVLPLGLREAALGLRGTKNYSKLWKEIEGLNARVGLPHRGHLEQIISRQRAALNPYQSRLELLTGQIGAVFFLGESPVGIEIAPTAAYFGEVGMALVCFCYGVAALYAERRDKRDPASPLPFEVKSLAEVRTQLARSRRERQEQALHWLNDLPAEQYAVTEE